MKFVLTTSDNSQQIAIVNDYPQLFIIIHNHFNCCNDYFINDESS